MMAISISERVGYHGRRGGNLGKDVKNIHGLLAGLPEHQRGDKVKGFDPTAGYSPKTDQAIYNFQTMHGLTADATVDKIGRTIDLLNRLSSYKGDASPTPNPAPPPPTAPSPAPVAGEPRRLLLTVSNRTVGKGLLMGYEPAAGKPHKGLYEADLYELILSQPETGNSETFRAFRFGPSFALGGTVQKPTITGIRGAKDAILTFGNHHISGSGGWKIPVANPNAMFLVHGGTADPRTPAANNGCVMITGKKVDRAVPGSKARHEWFLFRDWVCRMAMGEPDYAEDGSLEERISKANKMRIIIEPVNSVSVRLIDEKHVKH